MWSKIKQFISNHKKLVYALLAVISFVCIISVYFCHARISKKNSSPQIVIQTTPGQKAWTDNVSKT
jgi:hypothetical protein